MTRVIEHGNVDAISDLPVNSVLLCRVDEVFQCKPVDTEFGAGRAWYALGYGDRVWSAQEVAEWGPLRVLYRPDEDVPEGIMFCGWCQGTGVEDVGALVPGTPCRYCRGLAYWDVELQEPISLEAALARVSGPSNVGPLTKAAAARIGKAWTEPGIRPDIHGAAQQRLRREWPALAQAVEALVREAGR